MFVAKDKKSTKSAPPPVAEEEIKVEPVDASPSEKATREHSDALAEPIDITPAEPEVTLTADQAAVEGDDQTQDDQIADASNAEQSADVTDTDVITDPVRDTDAADTVSADEVQKAEQVTNESSETAEETVSEDATEPKPAPPPAPQRSGGFWPALFGGIVAALLGFIAGRGDMLDAYFPRADLPEPVDLSPLTAEIGTLSSRLGALETAEAPELPDLSPELGDLSQSLASLETTLESLAARLEVVEARPTATAPEPVVDNSEEIAALQSTVSDLEARLAEEDSRASAEAQRLLARAALIRVVTAVENGEAFEPALGALEDVTPVEVPEALRNAAVEGVPSVAALRESFPEAARAALAAARAEVPESEVSGIGGFLRRQLSARSVTPREGNDPDAILSRVEAALRASDLDTALAEAEALPAPAQAAMQGWLDSAQTRQTAAAAAQSLSDSLTVN
ncbi:hypothetical protein So717_11450 [Roseobacter cerasinus]|uniref:Mitochondrial inner membrane protein n=1 Tax=Roseobacter cerasinus TaxID=2602289 RepID=A0A640VP02_9RHOB|nr:hypothetical protein So717_11450 [Roseobacter cerasinus]